MTLSTEAVARPMTYTVVSDASREQALNQARVRGHAAGFAVGVAEATRKMEAERVAATEARAVEARQEAARMEYVLSLLQKAGEAMQNRAAPVLDGMEEALSAAALELAEVIIGRELADGENSARSALARATALPAPFPVHTIRMHPADLAILDAAARASAGLNFTADASLDRGDAVAEYSGGFLDARLSTAVERMRAVLSGDGE